VSLNRIGLQAWVLLFVGAVGTTLSAAAEVRIGLHLLWVVPLFLWAMRVRPALPPSLTWALIATLTAYGVVSLTSSSPWLSLETAGYAAAAAALFVVAASLTVEYRTYVARAVLIAVSGWLAALVLSWGADQAAWLFQAGWPPPWEPTRNYVWLAGNAIPVVVLLTVPFTQWLGSTAADRFMARLLVVLAVPTVLLSGGLIGLAGIVSAGAAYLVTRHAGSRRGLRLVMGAALLLVFMVGAAWISGGGSLPSTAEARLSLWGQGVQMMAEDPLTGAGPGMSAIVRRDHVDATAPPILTDHLHSAVVQAGAEGGALLLVALSAAVVSWSVAVWRARSRVSAHRMRVVIACLSGVALTMLADSFFDLPVVVALLVTVAAWVSIPEATAPAREGRLPVLRGAIAVLALLSVIPVVSADTARLAAADGRRDARRDDWGGALANFETAARRNPFNPLYHLEAGAAARELDRTQLAAEHFAIATSAVPADGRSWGALASVTSDPQRSIELLRLAADRTDGDPQYAYRLGRLLEDAGSIREAGSAYAEAVILQPDLIVEFPRQSTTSPTREQVVLEIARRLDGNPGIASPLSSMIRWDLELVADTLGDDAPAQWRAVDAARDGDRAVALAFLAAAQAEAPTDPRTWQAAVAVYRLACSPDEADRAQTLERLLAGSHRFQRDERVRNWERVYREPSLGDFQPPGLVPPDEQWPAPLISVESSCQ